jgi:N-acetylmuramoyl-L-alanine amidase
MAKVILDAGHGGSDIGDSYGNRMEKEDALKLTIRVGQILESKGIEVEYTRRSDANLSQLDRVFMANNSGGDLFVSIHRLFGNSFAKGPGLDFFVRMADSLESRAAHIIGSSLSKLGISSYGIIERTDVPILTNTDMPALMIGIGYMKSVEENEFFEENFEEIAQAIAEGIATSLDVLTNSEEKETVTDTELYYGDCPSEYLYRVQVGLFRSYNPAMNLQILLIQEGYAVDIVRQGDCYAVWVEEFYDLEEAVELEHILRCKGYNAFVVAV